MSRQARKRRHRTRRGGSAGAADRRRRSLLAATLIVGVIAAVGYVAHVAAGHPDLQAPRAIGGGTSQVFAADGTRLGFIQSDELRTPVGWSEIPTDLKNATVRSRTSASTKTTASTSPASSVPRSRTWSTARPCRAPPRSRCSWCATSTWAATSTRCKQKIAEAKLAIEYKKDHSKRSILNSYLNDVAYGTVGGQTMIGVQAAARMFFNKPVSHLNLEQAALLAGLPQAPSQYNPLLDPAAARQRRNEVLAKMAELHYISHAQPQRAEHAPLETHRGTFYSRTQEDFFFEYVRELLIQRYGKQDRRTGRAEGLHDDQPATCSAWRAKRSPKSSTSPKTRPRRSSRSTRTTATSRRWPSPRATRSRSTTSPPTATASQARPSRRSTSPTRSRAGSTRTRPIYLSHTLDPGWLAAEPEL